MFVRVYMYKRLYALRALSNLRFQRRHFAGNMSCSERERLTVAVRSVEQDECLVLAFRLHGHEHKLRRPKEETLGKSLKRISLVASKPEAKGKGRKKKWRKEEDDTPIEAHLYCGTNTRSALVPEDVPNTDAWVDGNVLVIGSDHYTVELNPPALLELKMPDCCMAGYPLVPQVEVEFTDPFSCVWVWRRYIGNALSAAAKPSATNADSNDSIAHLPDVLGSPLISRSFAYWPNDDDIGHQLVVECTPATQDGRRGIPMVAVSSPVIQGPVGSPIACRHLLTPGFLAGHDQMRMVTYNILADRYATSMFARTRLYPYCDPTALTREYRECLVVQELLGYHADVVCLQEVDMRSFHHFIYPAMREKGYEGSFCRKAGQIPEGEATFINLSKFTLLSTECIILREFLQSDPSCATLYQELRAAPSLLHDMLNKHTILQVVFAECVPKPGHYVCIANTHLYFHPLGNVIRLLQVEVILRAISKLLEKFKQFVCSSSDDQPPKIAVAFAGDFNSCPCIAPYNYLTSGSIKKEDPEWMSYKLLELAVCECMSDFGALGMEEEEDIHTNNTGPQTSLFRNEGRKDKREEGKRKTGEVVEGPEMVSTQENCTEDGPDCTGNDSSEASVWPRRTRTLPPSDTFEGLNLWHNFRLSNATGTTHPTNICVGFQGVLDYIFIDSDHLQVERLVPFPPMEEVTQFVALPSIYFPSDHLAVVVDLKWI